MRKWWAILIIPVALLISGVLLLTQSEQALSPTINYYNEGKVTLNDHEFSIDIAETNASRRLGLSGRTGLERDQAMLFVYEQPGIYGFWMKDMLFSIDIIWAREDGTIVHIEENVSPDTYPDFTFSSSEPAQKILETRAGMVAELGVELGDVILQ